MPRLIDRLTWEGLLPMRATRLCLLTGIALLALAAAGAGSPQPAAADSIVCSGHSYPVLPWCPGEKTLAGAAICCDYTIHRRYRMASFSIFTFGTE